MSGTLILHRGARPVTRDELATVATPDPTPTWRPIPHADLVAGLADQFARRDIAVVREQLAVQRAGRLLFGVFDLSVPGPDGDFRAAFGFRTSNDKSLAIRAVAGLRVMCCDNLALSGDQIILRRLHTAKLNVADEVAQAVGRFAERYTGLVGEVARMKARAITDTEAKAAIYDAFHRDILPVRLFRVVGREYFEPSHDYATGATLWRLHNAFTSAMKLLSPGRQMTGLTALGRYFTHLLN